MRKGSRIFKKDSRKDDEEFALFVKEQIMSRELPWGIGWLSD